MARRVESKTEQHSTVVWYSILRFSTGVVHQYSCTSLHSAICVLGFDRCPKAMEKQNFAALPASNSFVASRTPSRGRGYGHVLCEWVGTTARLASLSATVYWISSVLSSTVSGNAPLHPVVSVKSGNVYEKELILQYLKWVGNSLATHCYVMHSTDMFSFPAVSLVSRNNDSKDPITGEILSEDDLVDVKTSE